MPAIFFCISQQLIPVPAPQLKVVILFQIIELTQSKLKPSAFTRQTNSGIKLSESFVLSLKIRCPCIQTKVCTDHDYISTEMDFSTCPVFRIVVIVPPPGYNK